MDTDLSVVLARDKGEWGEVEVGKGGYGDGNKLCLGWQSHDAVCRWHFVVLYTCNLYGFVNQCHPNQEYIDCFTTLSTLITVILVGLCWYGSNCGNGKNYIILWLSVIQIVSLCPCAMTFTIVSSLFLPPKVKENG